jgi:two-component system chemotaxis response regulator CheY
MDEFKILIVDDSAVYRKLLGQQVFALESCSVLVARSGQEAIEIFEAQRPALVITDWVMPDLTGIELCHKIRAAGPNYTYIIILTSNAEKKDIVKGFSAGADDYLTKPFDRDELLARIRVGMRLVDLQRQIETKNRLLEELALTDALTGLPNRRAIVAWGDRQLEAAARHGFSFWVVLMDLDHFKSVNDTYGHEAGDAVLRKFGQILKANTRASEMSGRIGGEEFLQVITFSEQEGVRTLAERIRKQLAEETFHFGGSAFQVTASFGASGFSGRQAPEFGALVGLADAVLYRAKHLGRNRVEIDALQECAVH